MILDTKKKDFCFRVVAISLISIGALLCVVGFIVPPVGSIDGSVITAFGEAIGAAGVIAAWAVLDKALDRGVDAKVQHGDTSIELTNPDDNGNE